MKIIDLIDKQIFGKKITTTTVDGVQVSGILHSISWSSDWSWLGFRLKFKNGESVAIEHNTEIFII